MPSTDFQGPDNRTYRFPDGTTKDQADAYFRAKGIRGRAPVAPSLSDEEARAQASKESSSATDRLLAPANEAADLAAYDPNTLRGYGARTGQALKGIAAGIKGFLTTPPAGTKGNPIIWNPKTQFEKDWQGMKDWNELRKVNPDYAWGTMLGPMLLTRTVSRLLTPAGMAAKLTRGTGGMAADIEPTVNDLRAVTRDVNPKTGTAFGDPATIGDFVEQTGVAEAKLNREYANALGSHANDPGPITPNGTFPVSDAILKLKDKIGDTTPQDKAARAYIDQIALRFQKPLTLDELNRQRIAANGRLYSFENKSDVAQYAAAGANAGTAVDRAIANTVRDVVYPKMDQLTGKPPGYFRDLQNRVGNLFQLQSDSKEFATQIHQKSMISRGSTPMERVRPGGAVSAHGGVHGYLSNLPAMFKAPDPEVGANAAIRSGYGMRPGYTMRKVPLSSLVTSKGARVPVPNPPPEAMSLPISALLGAIERPKTRLADMLKPVQSNVPMQ